MNPSFGIKFNDLEALFPKESGGIYHCSVTLSSITDITYSDETEPKNVADDIVKFGLPLIEKFKLKENLISALEGEQPSNWPVASK